MPTKADLEREVEELRVSLRREQAALNEFKEQVRETAIEVAAEQDWCTDGLNRVLGDLGLPTHSQEFEVSVLVRFYFRGTTDEPEPSQDWVSNSLSGLDNVELDEDWEVSDSDYTVESVTVETVE